MLDWPGFIAFGQSFVDAFSDGRHEFDFVVAEGDTVATVGHYRGCHDGELMGVAPTGNHVDFTVMHVDRVRDGRIVEHRGIGDINTMWAQLGVDPPAPAEPRGGVLAAAPDADRPPVDQVTTGRAGLTGSSLAGHRGAGSRS